VFDASWSEVELVARGSTERAQRVGVVPLDRRDPGLVLSEVRTCLPWLTESRGVDVELEVGGYTDDRCMTALVAASGFTLFVHHEPSGGGDALVDGLSLNYGCGNRLVPPEEEDARQCLSALHGLGLLLEVGGTLCPLGSPGEVDSAIRALREV
jgi:hypothetical protein